MRSKRGWGWRTSGSFRQVFVCSWNAINVSLGDV